MNDSSCGSLESPLVLPQQPPPTAAEEWLPEQGSCMKRESEQHTEDHCTHHCMLGVTLVCNDAEKDGGKRSWQS